MAGIASTAAAPGSKNARRSQSPVQAERGLQSQILGAQAGCQFVNAKVESLEAGSNFCLIKYFFDFLWFQLDFNSIMN